MNTVEKIIAEKFTDIGWMNAYWLDEVKEEFPDIPEQTIDEIYAKKLQEKIDSLPQEELKRILSEQEEETSANQNYFLQELIEEKLHLAD